MSREKAGFRDAIELLNDQFPGKGMLTRSDVAAFLGVKPRSRKLDRIRFNAATRLVSKADLARQICV